MLPFADLAIRKDRYFLHREGSAMPDLHSSFNWVVIMNPLHRGQRIGIEPIVPSGRFPRSLSGSHHVD